MGTRVPAGLLALLIPLAAEPIPYAIRPAQGNRLALEVEKTGLLSGKKHLFLYERYQGRLEYDAQAPEKSRIELSIEGASAVCQDTWVKAKDLKPIQEMALELMAVQQHPALHFLSRRVGRIGANQYEVTGDLTIRGVTKPASVLVTLQPEGAAPVFSGTATVKMKDYGIKPPSAALGLVGTKDEMRVHFRLVAQPAS
jgi:polyisoprenoid-binding protein YceI